MLAYCKQNMTLTYVESGGPIMDKIRKVKKCSADIHL